MRSFLEVLFLVCILLIVVVGIQFKRASSQKKLVENLEGDLKSSNEINHKYEIDFATLNEKINHLQKIEGELHRNKFDSNWKCPICSCIKRECVKKSNKNNWFFTTVNKLFFEKLNENWCETIDICHECDRVSNLIRKEIDSSKKLEWSDYWFVKKDELKQVILSSSAHTNHKINNALYEQFIPIWEKRMLDEDWTYSDKLRKVCND